MSQDLRDILASLAGHLGRNKVWPEGRGHEGWIAVETVSFFRNEHKAGVALDAPYRVATTTVPQQQLWKTKYADVYVQYPSGARDMQRHLFFELKCIPSFASARNKTLRDFSDDVQKKLKHLDVNETRNYWHNPDKQEAERAAEKEKKQRKLDAWLQRLGTLRAGITAGQFIGIGMLFFSDENRKGWQDAMDKLRADLHDKLILEQEIWPDPSSGASEAATWCLAYRVDLVGPR